MPSNTSEGSGNHDSLEVFTSRTPRRTRSKVWEHYEHDYVDVDGEKKAVCKYCGILFSTRFDTSSLRSHIATACPAIDTHIRKQFCATLSKQPSEEPFVFDSKVCREGMIKYIIHAEIPFLQFEDPYLQPWLRTLQPTFEVRGRQTIRNECLKKYEDMKKELYVEFLNLDSRVCLTSDIWTSKQNLGYMVVTAHFVDAHFKIKKKIIWFKSLEYPHSGYAIEEELIKCLNEWGIREKIFTFTVDNASNNTTACELLVTDHKHDLMFDGQHLHVRCSAHILNILVQDGMMIIHSAIHKIRELLRHIDSSVSRLQVFNSIANGKGLASKSGIYLDIPTRWNSTYKMLRQALKYKAALNTYALKYYQAAPSDEEWEKAKAICKFLKAFEQLTLDVSAHRRPTAHKFLPLVLCIHHALRDPGWQKTDLLKELDESMLSKFDKYWEPDENNIQSGNNPRRKNKEIAFNIALLIATVLDPRRKVVYLDFFFQKVCRNVDQISVRVNYVKEWVRRYFAKYKQQHPSAGVTHMVGSRACGASTVGSPVLGKRKLEAEFAQFKTQVRVSSSQKSEIDLYFEEETEADAEDFDVVAWWKSKSNKYPILSTMARDFLAIPLSTVSSEAAFSLGGRILGDHRTSLTPEMLEALVCGKDWLFKTKLKVSDGEAEDIEEISEDEVESSSS